MQKYNALIFIILIYFHINIFCLETERKRAYELNENNQITKEQLKPVLFDTLGNSQFEGLNLPDLKEIILDYANQDFENEYYRLERKFSDEYYKTIMTGYYESVDIDIHSLIKLSKEIKLLYIKAIKKNYGLSLFNDIYELKKKIFKYLYLTIGTIINVPDNIIGLHIFKRIKKDVYIPDETIFDELEEMYQQNLLYFLSMGFDELGIFTWKLRLSGFIYYCYKIENMFLFEKACKLLIYVKIAKENTGYLRGFRNDNSTISAFNKIIDEKMNPIYFKEQISKIIGTFMRGQKEVFPGFIF